MRAFAAVFAREVAERRLVFLVGLCCGVPTLVASALHGWNTPGNAEVRLLAASVGGLALAVALALLYGGSMIAGETAEKRISFWFSRPIPAAAIWAGKLLAAVFVSLSAGFLVFVPGWLTGPEHARGVWGFNVAPGLIALAAVALVTVCVLAGHAVVTIARLRSPWVALDLLLAPTLVFLTVLALRSLARDSFTSDFREGRLPATVALVGVLVAVGLGLTLATFVQVAEGRTDARRAHGAFSVAFFGISGFAVLLLGGYAAWCASAKATDLATTGSVYAAPRGPWISAAGPLRAWRGTGQFLFDTAGGRSLRIRTWCAAFSQDGAHAAWGEPRFGFLGLKYTRSELFVADLATGRGVATGLEFPGWCALAFSPDGNRLALRYGRAIDVFDVSTPENPKQLAAFQAEGDRHGLAFVDNDTLRVYPSTRYGQRQGVADAQGPQLEITEFSLSSKKSLVTGRFERETLPLLRLGSDARLFVGTRSLTDDPTGLRALTLHDGRTGALVATLATDLRIPQARFLTGNRIAVAGVAGATARVLFFEGEKGWGSPARTVELGPVKRVVLGGEIAPGRVALSLFPFEENLPASRRAAKLVAVDAATGAVTPLADGLLPANRMGWWFDPVLPAAEAGSPASSLFLDPDNRLVRLDPATGAQTVLLGKGK